MLSAGADELSKLGDAIDASSAVVGQDGSGAAKLPVKWSLGFQAKENLLFSDTDLACSHLVGLNLLIEVIVISRAWRLHNLPTL